MRVFFLCFALVSILVSTSFTVAGPVSVSPAIPLPAPCQAPQTVVSGAQPLREADFSPNGTKIVFRRDADSAWAHDLISGQTGELDYGALSAVQNEVHRIVPLDQGAVVLHRIVGVWGEDFFVTLVKFGPDGIPGSSDDTRHLLSRTRNPPWQTGGTAYADLAVGYRDGPTYDAAFVSWTVDRDDDLNQIYIDTVQACSSIPRC